MNPMVERMAVMEPEEREAYLDQRSICSRCNQFREWLAWAQSEPTSLQSFLWDLYDEHVEQAGEAAWSAE